MSDTTTSKKTYHGSCICGAIKYAADLDFAQGTSKCNCTICRKLRFWSAKCRPHEFKLLPSKNSNTNEAPKEQDVVTDYYFQSPMIHQLFCRTCGTHAYHRGDVPEVGGEFVSINIACLDDVDDAELVKFKVRYCDGRKNEWWNEPKDATWL
jgi:hypothetical protein